MIFLFHDLLYTHLNVVIYIINSTTLKHLVQMLGVRIREKYNPSYSCPDEDTSFQAHH